MTHKATDKVISKVFKNEGGTGKKAWTRYDIYFEGSENKYAWFGNIVPTKGAIVKSMEYDIEQSGKYTNYNIKKLELDESGNRELRGTSSHASTAGTSSNNVSNPLPNSNCTMFISYAKDIVDAKIMMGEYKGVALSELVELYMQAGMNSFYEVQDWHKRDHAEKEIAEKNTEPSAEDVKKFAEEKKNPQAEEEPPEIRDDETPFPGDF